MALRQSVYQAAFGAIGGAVVTAVLVTWGVDVILGQERSEVYRMLVAVPGAVVGGLGASPGSTARMEARIAVAAGGLLTVFLLVAGFLIVQERRVLGLDLGFQRLLLVVFVSFEGAAICGLFIGRMIIGLRES